MRSWVLNQDFGPLLRVMRDPDLLDFETDLTLPVATYEPSVDQAVEQVLDASVLCVNVEESNPAECKADKRASCAACFSFMVAFQCSRLLRGFGVRYWRTSRISIKSLVLLC